MTDDVIKVVYSSDNNYFKLMVISTLSLIQYNKNLEIYYLIKNIEEKDKEYLRLISERYDIKIHIVDILPFCNKLRFWKEEEDCRYLRLILGQIIKEDKVLYLDCDVMVNDELGMLWNIDISKYYGAAVLDTVRKAARVEAGIENDNHYFNSGVLLINLKKWNEDKLIKKFTLYKLQIRGKGIYKDQRIINACISKNLRILHPKYNLMPEMIYYNVKQIKKLSGIDTYYTERELTEAQNRPIIIHFAGRSIDRPWYKNCDIKYKEKYRFFMQKEDAIIFELCSDRVSNCIKWKIKRNLPFFVVQFFSQIRNMKII